MSTVYHRSSTIYQPYPYPPYQPSSIHTGHRTQDTGHTISEITIKHPHEVQINTQQSLRHTISYFAGIIALLVKPAIFLSTENGKWENIPSSVYTRLASTRSLSPSLTHLPAKTVHPQPEREHKSRTCSP